MKRGMIFTLVILILCAAPVVAPACDMARCPDCAPEMTCALVDSAQAVLPEAAPSANVQITWTPPTYFVWSEAAASALPLAVVESSRPPTRLFLTLSSLLI